MAGEPPPFRDGLAKALDHAENLRAILLRLTTEMPESKAEGLSMEKFGTLQALLPSQPSDAMVTFPPIAQPSDGMIALSSCDEVWGMAQVQTERRLTPSPVRGSSSRFEDGVSPRKTSVSATGSQLVASPILARMTEVEKAGSSFSSHMVTERLPTRVAEFAMQPHSIFLPSKERRGSVGSKTSRFTLGATSSLELEESTKEPLKLLAYTWRPLHPDGIAVTVWEVLGIIAMIGQLYIAPWSALVESVDRYTAVFYISVAACCYWTFDIFVLFVTAFYDSKLQLQRRWQTIATCYIKSWFFFDSVLVVTEWLLLWFASTATSVAEPANHLLLAVVGLRLLRQFGRFRSAFEKLHMLLLKHGIDGNWLSKIASFLVFFSLFNHIMSCVWYKLGTAEASDTDLTWQSQLTSVQQTNERYLYLTSVHWSLTQLLPGSMEVVPTNTVERVFNVIVLICGWVFVLTCTAILTSLMTQKRLQIEQRDIKQRNLWKYLHQEKVEQALAMSIQRQVEARAREKFLLKAQDVEALTMLSGSLRKELAFSIHAGSLRNHSYLSIMEVLDRGAFMSICCNGIDMMHYRAEDVVFEEATSADSMGFVTGGILSYVPGYTAAEFNKERNLLVKGGAFSEAALWCQWIHLGSMSARTNAEVMTVEAPALGRILRRHPDAQHVTQEFCMSVVRCYNSSVFASKWSDLQLIVDYADIIGDLPKECRIHIGEALMDHLLQRKHWGLKVVQDHHVQKLREEIQSGACFVSRHGEEVFRTVFIVALQLRSKADGRVFAQLGEVSSDGSSVTKAACQLPGCKRKEQESAWAAVQRLLAQDLHAAESIVLQQDAIDGAQLSVRTFESGTYGIRSRYIKTTFEAAVDHEGLFQAKSTGKAKHSMSKLCSGILEEGANRPSCCLPGWRCVRAYSSHTLSNERADAFLDTLAGISEVVVMSGRKGGREIFAWLTDEDYALLQSPDAGKALRAFLKALLAEWGDDSDTDDEITFV